MGEKTKKQRAKQNKKHRPALTDKKQVSVPSDQSLQVDFLLKETNFIMGAVQ